MKPRIGLLLALLMNATWMLPLKAQLSWKPVRLACEYLPDPLGLDTERPRFSWQLPPMKQGERQQAFEIVAGTDSANLLKGENICWTSGKIYRETVSAEYAGRPLSAFNKYFWAVRIWNHDDQVSLYSDIGHFEMGMMRVSNWKGTWISDHHDIEEKAAPLFRHEFQIEKKIKNARAYMAAGGLYELSFNGKKTGDHRLDPMYTRFDRRVLYVTYDITRQLQQGDNAVGVVLGNGWYNHQSTAVWNFHNAPWRARPAFCLDIRIEYEDGTTQTISTNKNWKTATGSLIFNSVYTAEHYDARLEQKDWNLPGFRDKNWKNVTLRAAPANLITAQVMHPVRDVDTLSVAAFRKINDTTFLFDMGRNISGVSAIALSGERGTILRLKHGERLDSNGRVDQSNIDVHYRPTDDLDPFQTDIYTLNGEGVEHFRPVFNYKGFRYVELRANRPVQINEKSLKAYFMHSDVPPRGSIHSSNTTINKIWAATNNSYLSNLFGYPTDCPQREKNGWTGDAHIAVETGLYNFDAITIYEKWMRDHQDEQQPNGVLPSIIPTGGWGYEWGNGPDWTSTIALIPWNVYLFYGDTNLLAACYDNIKRYVDHITEEFPSGITSWGLGDWVPVKSKTPVPFTSTAYYYTDVRILARTASILGKSADQIRYAALAEKIKTAFNNEFLNAATAVYGSGLQTEMSVALHWELVPDSLKSRVAANLADRVRKDGVHLDVGLLGTKTILNALSDHGYPQLAWQLASNETFPSWGWWIVNGATTLYENWPIDAQSDISQNHIMFGEIGAWLFKGPGGIKPDPAAPGFRNILLEPKIVDGPEHFEAKHVSPYGEIVSSWKKKKNTVVYKAVVPPGSTASLTLPLKNARKIIRNGLSMETKGDFYKEHLSSGTFLFEWKW